MPTRQPPKTRASLPCCQGLRDPRRAHDGRAPHGVHGHRLRPVQERRMAGPQGGPEVADHPQRGLALDRDSSEQDTLARAMEPGEANALAAALTNGQVQVKTRG